MGSFRACTSGSTYNMWTSLPATKQSCACRTASRNLSQHFFSFPAAWPGCGQRYLHSADRNLVETSLQPSFSFVTSQEPGHIVTVQTPAATSSPCCHWSCTGVSNDGKIQGPTLECSLPRYFLQILSQNEVRGAVSSLCWHTWAMSHAVGRCKGMEIHGNMMLSERTKAVKFTSVIYEADNTHHKSPNETEMCGKCKSF